MIGDYRMSIRVGDRPEVISVLHVKPTGAPTTVVPGPTTGLVS
jgi:hypothetical protein